MDAVDIPAHNVVALTPNSVILAVLSGFQDVKAATALSQDLARLVRQLRSQHKRVVGLLDVSRTTDHSIETEAIYADFLKNGDYDALAVYGVGRLKYSFITELGAQTGQAHRFRPFASEHEATRWLAAYIQKHPAAM